MATAITDAYPELERERKFHPLGVENPSLLTQEQIDHYNEKALSSRSMSSAPAR